MCFFDFSWARSCYLKKAFTKGSASIILSFLFTGFIYVSFTFSFKFLRQCIMGNFLKTYLEFFLKVAVLILKLNDVKSWYNMPFKSSEVKNRANLYIMGLTNLYIRNLHLTVLRSVLIILCPHLFASVLPCDTAYDENMCGPIRGRKSGA